MYALVDCNNFYVSCERLFQPHLRNQPVVVLSNNDGCIIARSDEAKALGIGMGAPAHHLSELLSEKSVTIFSSNYTLYGDMSDRVMKTLSSFVPRIELYSIDEAFLDLHDLAYSNLVELALKIRKTVMQNIGIPVTVGIAATKTLAKMANRYAKKKFKDVGVFYATPGRLVTEMLASTTVEDIWGIGANYAKLLKKNNVHTAKDVTDLPPDWMRSKMSVVGLRLWNELQGIPAIQAEFDPKPKKNICSSRSFGKLTEDYTVLQEAASNFASTCAEKLRKQGSVARAVHVFVTTNPFKADSKQYSRSITIQCETPTNLPGEIIGYALKGLDIVHQSGYRYHKCGVMVLDLIPENEVQRNMFDDRDRAKGKQIAGVMDALNGKMGKGTVRMAVQRFDKRYRLRAEKLSRKYTTDPNELLDVKI
jgi:DNA polymerase V